MRSVFELKLRRRREEWRLEGLAGLLFVVATSQSSCCCWFRWSSRLLLVVNGGALALTRSCWQKLLAAARQAAGWCSPELLAAASPGCWTEEEKERRERGGREVERRGQLSLRLILPVASLCLTGVVGEKEKGGGGTGLRGEEEMNKNVLGLGVF